MNKIDRIELTQIDPRVAEIAFEAASRHGWEFDCEIDDTAEWDRSAWVLRLVGSVAGTDEFGEVYYVLESGWCVDVEFDSSRQDRGADHARAMARWLTIAADLADELNDLTSASLELEAANQ